MSSTALYFNGDVKYVENLSVKEVFAHKLKKQLKIVAAAKSVFHFGDLKNDKELKHTEYVLAGNFQSSI